MHYPLGKGTPGSLYALAVVFFAVYFLRNRWMSDEINSEADQLATHSIYFLAYTETVMQGGHGICLVEELLSCDFNLSEDEFCVLSKDRAKHSEV